MRLFILASKIIVVVFFIVQNKNLYYLNLKLGKLSSFLFFKTIFKKALSILLYMTTRSIFSLKIKDGEFF